MPIVGVLDLQRRSLPLGQIRIGESEPIPGKRYRKPVRRETFRFTTPVLETAEAIAAKFGGEPQPWDRRPGYWKVDTDQRALEVWVPPRGLAVDAWMELWDGGKCRRRCDGITEQRSGQECMCPQPEDRDDPAQVARAANERKRLAAEGKACKPTTRISVQIPGLPGVTGVWQLRTGSANAAVETADTGEVLERARSMDVYLPALLVIDWRQGQDGKPYPVLTLRLRPSAEQIRELPAGMDGMLAQLGAGPLALTAGAGQPAPPAGPAKPPGAGEPVTAAQIAALIPLTGTREDVGKLIKRAKAAGQLDVVVWAAAEGDDAETGEELRNLLDARWWELPGPPRTGRQRQPAQRAEEPLPPEPQDGGLWAAGGAA